MKSKTRLIGIVSGAMLLSGCRQREATSELTDYRNAASNTVAGMLATLESVSETITTEASTNDNVYYVQHAGSGVTFRVSARNRGNAVVRIPSTVWTEAEWKDLEATLSKLGTNWAQPKIIDYVK